MQDELQRNNLELENVKDKIKENQEKIKLNKQLPYLVGNIVEVRASPAPGICPIWMWMRKLWVSVPSSFMPDSRFPDPVLVRANQISSPE